VLIIGLTYLLSDPFVIISSYLLPEWNRQWYYRVVDQTVHVLTQGYLVIQMRSAKSEYNKSVNQFTSLPGLT